MHYCTCSLSYKHVFAGLLPYLRQQHRARAHAAEVLAELKRKKDKPIKPATSSAKPDLAAAETSPAALFETFSLASATAAAPAASSKPAAAAAAAAAWSLTDNLAAAVRDGTSSADARVAAVRAGHTAERAQQDAAFEQSLEDDR
jgi:hypothetical protein